MTVDTNYIRKETSYNGTPALGFGAEFTRYYGPQGIIVELYKNPMYDSEMYCKRNHPLYPNMPIDSARMTILNFSGDSTGSNVSMVKEKNSFTRAYVPGMVGPNGPLTGGMTASLNHGYDTAIQTSAGLHITDVSLCGELIYEIG